MPGPDQPTAPYLDALVSYAFRGSGRFHIPGHKGGYGADPGLLHALGADALSMDIPPDIQGIDAGPSPTPYQRAEELAAEAHGAARTWFLTNGATQGNHAMTLAVARLGSRVVAQRNAHASLVDGLVLSGGIPRFVNPAYDEGLGMAHGVTPDALREALADAPDACAAFVVSPTYYGLGADVAALAEVAHDAGVPLVVDQAWGPHFGFHPDLPESALKLGADAVLTSTHKIGGSLTQSAMLHLGHQPDPPRIDERQISRAIRLVRSTSPSALLLGSLDGARRQLAMHGEALIHQTLAALEKTREHLGRVPGVRLVGPELVGAPGVASWDPMRIVLDVRETGCSGYEVAAALRAGYDVQPELATHATVVLVSGPVEDPFILERMAGDVDETIKRIMRPGTTVPVVRAPAHTDDMAVSPRDAFLGDTEVVTADEAVGRVSCESIAGYPPGIPALLPGERISADTIRYLRELVESGARLHGASDPTLQTINVLR